jgi:DNA-binding MarR family transcriptional regulator
LQHVAKETFCKKRIALLQKHYTDTIFYQIELTAKYCKLLGAQVFEQFKTGITIEEFAVLDTLLCNKELCQRDLAKQILKDRANTGKLLDSLEKKGLLTRKLAMKNNRPVKIIQITEVGKKKVLEAADRIRPYFLMIKEKIDNSDLARVGDLLKELRNILNDSLKIQI